MIPLEGLSFEHYGYYYRKDSQRYHLLHDLQLHKIEGTSVVDETDSVSWNLCTVFEKSDSPREQDDRYQGPA